MSIDFYKINVKFLRFKHYLSKAVHGVFHHSRPTLNKGYKHLIRQVLPLWGKPDHLILTREKAPLYKASDFLKILKKTTAKQFPVIRIIHTCAAGPET